MGVAWRVNLKCITCYLPVKVGVLYCAGVLLLGFKFAPIKLGYQKISFYHVMIESQEYIFAIRILKIELTLASGFLSLRVHRQILGLDQAL